MISFVFLTCPSLISIQDLRLQRIAPIKSNQLSLHVKPAGKREQVPESLTQILNTSKCGTWRPPSLRNKSPPCPTSKLPVSEHPLEVCKESQPAPDPAAPAVKQCWAWQEAYLFMLVLKKRAMIKFQIAIIKRHSASHTLKTATYFNYHLFIILVIIYLSFWLSFFGKLSKKENQMIRTW